MIDNLAPLLIGAVAGWIIFYFIRRYKKFTPSMLMATLAAIVGGDGISSLAMMGERFGNHSFHLWYFTGIGVSFFLYAIYVLLIAIFYNKGKIKDKEKLEKFLGEEKSEE